jgi:hypothetical protein
VSVTSSVPGWNVIKRALRPGKTAEPRMAQKLTFKLRKNIEQNRPAEMFAVWKGLSTTRPAKPRYKAEKILKIYELFLWI